MTDRTGGARIVSNIKTKIEWLLFRNSLFESPSDGTKAPLENGREQQRGALSDSLACSAYLLLSLTQIGRSLQVSGEVAEGEAHPGLEDEPVDVQHVQGEAFFR